MAQVAEKTELLNVKDWLALEERSETRHQFYAGEVFAMAGTTVKHNEIVFNLTADFKGIFTPKGCRVVSENVKLEVEAGHYYTYPDVMVSCNEQDQEAEYILKHPSVIVEVLSKTTAVDDRGFKWERYQKIPSLKHYLLVAQDHYSVEVFSKAEGKLWTYARYEGKDTEIPLQHVGHTMKMEAVYANVKMGEEGTKPLE